MAYSPACSLKTAVSLPLSGATYGPDQGPFCRDDVLTGWGYDRRQSEIDVRTVPTVARMRRENKRSRVCSHNQPLPHGSLSLTADQNQADNRHPLVVDHELSDCSQLMSASVLYLSYRPRQEAGFSARS